MNKVKITGKKKFVRGLIHTANKTREKDMTEINNNIGSYGFKAGKTTSKKSVTENKNKDNAENNRAENEYIQDTGVLGRSQVKRSHGTDAISGIDSAVMTARTNPRVMIAADRLFDSVYDGFLKDGMNETAAYINACKASDEFMEIAAARGQ